MSIWSRIVGRKGAEPLALVLYTRAQCPLCDAMKAEIERARLGGRCALLVVDVEMDPILVERHGRSVPVLEIEGRVAFKGSLTAEELERKVARALHERGPA